MSDEVKLIEVSKNCIAVVNDNLRSNAGAVVLDNSIVVIDVTMRPDKAKEFRHLLESKYNRPVKYLCVTHYHGDHVFGLKPFDDVIIFASQPFKKNLERRMESDWSREEIKKRKLRDPSATWIDDVELFIPSLLFDKRMEVSEMDRSVKFYNSGGHTDCSVYGYFPEEKVLFAGDLIFSGGKIPYAGDNTCDPEKWMETLREWLDLDIEFIVPGHGPITGREEIIKQLSYFEKLKENTIKAIGNKGEPKDIIIPDDYTVGDNDIDRWVIEMTQKKWFNFYNT